MKPPYAHVSRTALVVVAAAGSVWLSAFFLPGSGLQPVPLLPALGGAAGNVVAASLPHAKKRTPAAALRPTRPAAAPVRVPVTPVFVPHAVQPRPAPRVVPRHRAHRPHAPAAPKRPPPVQAATPAPAVATVASVASTPAPRGKAVGWHRKHDHATATSVAAPPHGHGKSHVKHEYASSPQPAPTPAPASPPAPAAPAAPPSTGGHDNGKHLGNGNGNGNQGHGPGGKP
ncbi:MAG TPA: hypothetical protein VLD16_02265 [Gaiellaceae bacterium]|nr:hypothetical protein [Gaiellaceae bacterium]